MGGNFVYIFLRMMRPEWKKKFVRTAFFMAVPWGKTYNARLTYGPNFFIFKFTVILKPSEVLIDDDKFFPIQVAM